MTPRPASRSVECTPTDAKTRLHDAVAFLEIADIATDADVVATNAIHAAIAAADAICCIALRERSADGHHAAGVRLLTRVDRKLGNALGRCLDRKTQAAYESATSPTPTQPPASDSPPNPSTPPAHESSQLKQFSAYAAQTPANRGERRIRSADGPTNA